MTQIDDCQDCSGFGYIRTGEDEREQCERCWATGKIMDDEFKFRAWNETTRKMLFFSGIFNERPYTEQSTFPQYESCKEYDALRFMRFTGLADKDGSAIFEGDLIGSSTVKNSVLREVMFSPHHGAFVGRPVDDKSDLKYSGQGLTQTWIDDLGVAVIGNVYENAELLTTSGESANAALRSRERLELYGKPIKAKDSTDSTKRYGG